LIEEAAEGLQIGRTVAIVVACSFADIIGMLGGYADETGGLSAYFSNVPILSAYSTFCL
jgi:hypothetical protein